MNQIPTEIKVEMLIRKPAAEVFAAFIDPAITTRFWFTKSSGKLETGTKIRWEWEMYGVFTDITVNAIEANRRILITWDDGDTVEWFFAPRTPDQTFVTITNAGFSGDADAVVAKAIDSKGGFTMMICAAKAFLEHGINLNVVADHAPDAIVSG